jgi:hypothetical protein
MALDQEQEAQARGVIGKKKMNKELQPRGTKRKRREPEQERVRQKEGYGKDCGRYPPLKAATMLFRAEREVAEAEGGPPEDGGFAEGWLIVSHRLLLVYGSPRSADGA